MVEQSPLRRWKPFFAAFDLVDTAIEAADPALCRCRDEFRSKRGAVVEQLCGVPAGAAAGEAEKLCLVLDDFMAESLVTLRKVPACAVRRVLESSADGSYQAKLREGYRVVEDAKRQRKIQVIEAPKMLEQRKRKMHPIQARCGMPTAVSRRCSVSSFNRV